MRAEREKTLWQQKKKERLEDVVPLKMEGGPWDKECSRKGKDWILFWSF